MSTPVLHDATLVVLLSWPMGSREQELVEQMRQWRAAIDARPEAPWDLPVPSSGSPSRRLPIPSREDRAAERRAARRARLDAPSSPPGPVYRDINGVSLVYGPQAELEQAWQSGQPVRVRGRNGALYPVRLEKVCAPDTSGCCIAWPVGTQADRANIELLRGRGRPAPKVVKKNRRHNGTRRSTRTR